MIKAIRFIRAFSGLVRKRTWGPFTEISEVSKFDYAMSVSWSQSGEDLALNSVFKEMINGSYIDIGAHHPSRFSITRHLYQSGWSGVNVDANPALISDFLIDRPRDTSIHALVGSQKSYSFSIFSEPAISTHNDFWKSNFLSEGQKIIETREIPGMKLREIYDQYLPVGTLELLNIDAEGSDLDVFDSMEWKTLSVSRFPNWLLLASFPPVKNSIATPAVAKAIELGYEAWKKAHGK